MLCVLTIAGMSKNVMAQETEKRSGDKGSISIYANLLGFVQYGPIITAEYGLTDNISVNGHYRMPDYGYLSKSLLNEDVDGDAVDHYSVKASGVGLLYIYNKSNKKIKYFGLLLDFQKSNTVYAAGLPWEWYQENNTTVIALNYGKRYLIGRNIFINYGVYLGAAFANWSWDYSNNTYGYTDFSSRTGSDIMDFELAEFSIGIAL